MSAAIFTPTPPPSPAPTLPAPAFARRAGSLFEAVIEYEQIYRFLRLMERQSARAIMNAVDLHVPTGPAHDEIRTQVMQSLGTQRREIMSWMRQAAKDWLAQQVAEQAVPGEA